MHGHCVDIAEHLSDLTRLASKCNTVVEFGVREGWSTQAILKGKPKTLISYDIAESINIIELGKIALENDVNFQFRHQSSHDANIPECDFLFIDSAHTYECLKKELQLHKNKAKKIGFHDTVSCQQINKAIEEECNGWPVVIEKENNNGFLVLENPCWMS